MTENFANLLEESLSQVDYTHGALIPAKVEKIKDDFVIVDGGLKTESIISINEFMNDEGQLEVEVGSVVEVVVENVENGFGETRLSREKARRAEAWRHLEIAFEAKETIQGRIIERVKGGFTVLVNSLRAFLPGSLVDVRPVRDPSSLEDKELDFKIIKMDRRRNNIVVSRRAVVEQASEAERESYLENLEEGQVVNGIVKNVTDYGAFIDLGGIDGLLHITDMSWSRIKHPSELLNIGDEMPVKVLKFDRDKKRVSLGIKQLGEDPWLEIAKRYPVNLKMTGVVTNVTDYGCFVEIESGIEGLVHMSEMDWTNKNIYPSKVVSVGDEIEVMVLDIDENRRRISLGIKQCKQNPWDEFSATHQVGDKIGGEIRSITDFGVFIGLNGGIDGLIHLSDISWKEPGETAIRNYKKGDHVDAVILAIDPERERISLGVKQMDEDPFSNFEMGHPKGAEVEGKVTAVDAKGGSILLEGGVEGYLKASEISKGRIQDARDYLAEGETITATVHNLDRKNRIVYLSTKDAVSASSSSGDLGGATLGDLLKEQIEDKKEEDK